MFNLAFILKFETIVKFCDLCFQPLGKILPTSVNKITLKFEKLLNKKL